MLRSARWLWVLALLSLLPIGLAVGFVVAERQLFPYDQVLRVWARVSALFPAPRVTGSAETKIFDTSLLRLKADVFPWPESMPVFSPTADGGGIALLGDQLIGVDKYGAFFRYDVGGVFQQLPVRVETNIDDLQARNGFSHYFRFLDIAARLDGSRAELFVSYDFWHPDEQCKTTRVSRLIVGDVAALLTPSGSEQPDDWQLLFESQPCLEFSETKGSAFDSNVTGGRLLPDGRGGLFVTVGDHELDGINNPLVAAQDSAISYGKLLRIDLQTLEAAVYANGMRNPQGLFLDRAGTLWETEQGPKGGDELNVIRQDGNYGWPLTTFGTQYFQFNWQLNARQGQHQGRQEGFEAPVYAWIPSVGVSNLIRVEGSPEPWADDLLVGSLTGRTLFRIRIQDGRVLFSEPIAIGERIRDLVQMPNGTIVLYTDERNVIELTAESDGAGGADVIGTCGVCHGFAAETTNAAAPSLWGVYGREAGSTDFENYSAAMRAADRVWDEETLRAFLRDPQSIVPGTTMPPPPSMDAATLDTLMTVLRSLR
jgi:cytochrome c2